MQVWLTLNNLLVDPKARAKYDMDDYRKEAVLRVRRYMNDILLDQLPIVRDLQRGLAAVTMGVSAPQDECDQELFASITDRMQDADT